MYDDDLPSGNIFWIFTVSWTIWVSNFEYCSNWTSVFTGDSFETDVIFSTVFWMSMSWEWAGIWDFTCSWALESTGNFYMYRQRERQKKEGMMINSEWFMNVFFMFCLNPAASHTIIHKSTETKIILFLPSFLHSGTWSAHIQTRASRS